MFDPFYSYEDAGEAAGNTLPDTPTAIACGDINLNPQTFAALDDEPLRKSEILATARMSAIHSCKQAGLLLPMHLPARLTDVKVQFDFDAALSRIGVTVSVSANDADSLEIEALSGVNAALLSIYSALRHHDKTMILTQVHLLEQHDGKSSPFIFANEYENLSL